MPTGRRGRTWGWLLLLMGWCAVAAAQGAAAPAVSARPVSSAGPVSSVGPVSSGGPVSSAAPVASAALESDGAEDALVDPRARSIEALLAGELDVGIEPQSLFDVPLTDAAALAVEAERIRTLLATVEGPVASASASAALRPPRGPASARAAPGAPSAVVSAEVPLDPLRWRARLELDRARLAFYSLPAEERSARLAAHEARQEAAKPRETEAQRQAREAEAERQRALAAARLARTEAARLVSEELARLIGVEAAVVAVRERFAAEQAELEGRRDVVLGWQRRARDARSAEPEQADVVYDALRRSLRGAREELGKALEALGSSARSDVPSIGDDPLVELPPEVDAAAARERRAVVEAAIAAAHVEERALREERARRLLGEVNDLNRERLGLLPYLTSSRRAAVTGFSADGWDQARAELGHLLLIVRYDRRVAAEWLRSLRTGGETGISPWAVGLLGIPWLLLVALFVAWRRRGARWLALAEARLIEADHAARRVSPSVARRAVGFVAHVHRSLEWLLLALVTWWLLPAVVRTQMEVRLLAAMVGWVLAASLLVSVIDALSARSGAEPAADHDPHGALRLRSLRLVAWVAVVFILILVLADRLVGQGTIYSWVLSTCWLASVPVFLILIHWWKQTIFERVDRVRKKSPLEAWVLAHPTGWRSFVAAMVGGVHLFSVGVVKTVRGWIADFYLVRRAHAYLFRRELARLASGRPEQEAHPLSEERLAAFAPERLDGAWLSCPADAPRARLEAWLRSERGGVVAIVGARGMGKTRLLRQLSASTPGAVRVDGGDGEQLAALDRRLASGEATNAPRLVVLDDAQALVRPVVGGLAALDVQLAHARERATGTLWVMAFDAVLWPFIRRAREGRALFDEIFPLAPWSEDEVGALLDQRNAAVGIEPSFEDLLDRLPPTADELDRQDALAARRTGYVRMLWDHVDGNPGLALEAWRRSLVEDGTGSTRVRALQVPDLHLLDELSDAGLFVLRAVLQLAPAGPADVAAATRLSDVQVQGQLQYGLVKGYFEERDGRYDVAWRWLGVVIRLLGRRHLLVES